MSAKKVKAKSQYLDNVIMQSLKNRKKVSVARVSNKNIDFLLFHRATSREIISLDQELPRIDKLSVL